MKKTITAQQLNEISSVIMDDCHLAYYPCIEAMAEYFEWKVFGKDDEQWSMSQLKRQLAHYETAIKSFRQDNGHYSDSEQSYNNYIVLMYPKRPNDQVMVYRMRIGDHIPCDIRDKGRFAIHRWLKKYHDAFPYFKNKMEMMAKQTIKDGEK